jgi:hypothetical protein
MKPFFVLTLLAAAVASSLGQETATPKDADSATADYLFLQEIRMWKTLESHDIMAFRAFLLPDFIEVEKAIQNREQVLENLNACTLSGFKLSNHQVRMISPDAAVIAYNGFSQIICGESHLSGNYNATTTWVRRDGRWLVQMHTEIPVRR